MRKTFGKSEKLTNLRVIGKLFKQGSSYYSSPLRIIVYRLETKPESKSNIQVLISVPKKNIKKSVLRNRIKRQIREVYRLNKELTLASIEQNLFPLALAIVFVGKEIVSYNQINKAFLRWLSSFSKSK